MGLEYLGNELWEELDSRSDALWVAPWGETK
jgi:hypothetical protein